MLELIENDQQRKLNDRQGLLYSGIMWGDKNYVLGKSIAPYSASRNPIRDTDTNHSIFSVGSFTISQSARFWKDEYVHCNSSNLPESANNGPQGLFWTVQKRTWNIWDMETPYMVVRPPQIPARACPYVFDHHKGRLSANKPFNWFQTERSDTEIPLKNSLDSSSRLKHDRTGATVYRIRNSRTRTFNGVRFYIQGYHLTTSFQKLQVPKL